MKYQRRMDAKARSGEAEAGPSKATTDGEAQAMGPTEPEHRAQDIEGTSQTMKETGICPPGLISGRPVSSSILSLLRGCCLPQKSHDHNWR